MKYGLILENWRQFRKLEEADDSIGEELARLESRFFGDRPLTEDEGSFGGAGGAQFGSGKSAAKPSGEQPSKDESETDVKDLPPEEKQLAQKIQQGHTAAAESMENLQKMIGVFNQILAQPDGEKKGKNLSQLLDLARRKAMENANTDGAPANRTDEAKFPKGYGQDAGKKWEDLSPEFHRHYKRVGRSSTNIDKIPYKVDDKGGFILDPDGDYQIGIYDTRLRGRTGGKTTVRWVKAKSPEGKEIIKKAEPTRKEAPTLRAETFIGRGINWFKTMASQNNPHYRLPSGKFADSEEDALYLMSLQDPTHSYWPLFYTALLLATTALGGQQIQKNEQQILDYMFGQGKMTTVQGSQAFKVVDAASKTNDTGKKKLAKQALEKFNDEIADKTSDLEKLGLDKFTLGSS